MKIKHETICLTILGLVLAAGSALGYVTPTNLLQNPGFEDWAPVVIDGTKYTVTGSSETQLPPPWHSNGWAVFSGWSVVDASAAVDSQGKTLSYYTTTSSTKCLYINTLSFVPPYPNRISAGDNSPDMYVTGGSGLRAPDGVTLVLYDPTVTYTTSVWMYVPVAYDWGGGVSANQTTQKVQWSNWWSGGGSWQDNDTNCATIPVGVWTQFTRTWSHNVNYPGILDGHDFSNFHISSRYAPAYFDDAVYSAHYHYLTGRVVDTSKPGSPGVPGATVRVGNNDLIVDPEAPLSTAGAYVTVTADADGYYKAFVPDSITAYASCARPDLMYDTPVPVSVAPDSVDVTAPDIQLSKQVSMVTISGAVTQQGTSTGIEGIIVTATSGEYGAFPATTQADGGYSMQVPAGEYLVTVTTLFPWTTPIGASPWSVYTYDNDGFPQDVELDIELIYNDVPRAADLLFACLTDSLPASGQIGSWAAFYPDGGTLSPIGTPSAETIGGARWEHNVYVPWTVEHPELYHSDGFRFGSAYGSPIACNGASIVAAVKPIRNGAAADWTSVVDIFYDRLVLGVRNDTGVVNVARNGERSDSTAAISDGKRTVLSLVAQPDGAYKVWANGAQIMDVATTSDLTSLVPGVAGTFADYIDVGRNDPDGWSTFNGDIGDVYVYTAALSDDERQQLETSLIAKFGITTGVFTITASAGAGGSISPSGGVSVDSDSDKTFTITPSVGYAISDVLVDEVSVGPVGSYTFTSVSADHTIEATFSELATTQVSGQVVDQTTGLPIPGATVYFSLAPNASANASYTVTADGSGNFSLAVPSGDWNVCASHPTHLTSWDQVVTVSGDPVSGVAIVLAQSGMNVPRMSDLLFCVVGDSLPAFGQIGSWAVFHPLGLFLNPIGYPMVEMIGGRKWESNIYGDGDGFRLGTYSSPIPVNGASIVMAVKPVRNEQATPWISCVDIMYDRLLLGVMNDTGQVCVRRNGSPVVLSGAVIPDGAMTVLSLVVQPNGTYEVWANGAQIINISTTSDMTSLVPNVAGSFANAIDVGRNNPDVWTAFNGNIGDVFVYKVALNDADRQALEADITGRFGIGAEEVAGIGAAKRKADGALIRLAGPETVIYAPTNAGARTTAFFYIGEVQGLGGLKVVDRISDSLALGNQVANLIGHVRRPTNAEPYLELTVDPSGGAGASIAPLGMNNRVALTDAMTPTNAVKVWGRILSIDGATSFIIDDGYGIGITVNVNGVALPLDFDTTKIAVVTGILNRDLKIEAQDVQAF